MDELIVDLVLIVLSYLFGMFGNKTTAKKFVKFRRKLRAKQEKRVQKEAKKLEEDFEILKEME